MNDNNKTAEAITLQGRNAVLEALKAGTPLDTIYICGDRHADIIALAKERGIIVKKSDEARISKLCGGDRAKQDVVATGALVTYLSIEQLPVSENGASFYLLCDGIEDTHNLGAIIRTAEAAGVTALIIPERRSASVNTTVFTASAGAASWLPIVRVTNLPRTIDFLKERGVWVFGTDADGTEYTRTDFKGSTALVIGSEGKGISRLVKEKCDGVVSIGMHGKINSLNASVAAGIIMFEVVRQRSLT